MDSARSMSAPRRPAWSVHRNRYSIEAKAATGGPAAGLCDRSSSVSMARWSPRMSASGETAFATDRCTICRAWPQARRPAQWAPFKDWSCCQSDQAARPPRPFDEADRQFLCILAAIPEDGLDAVEDACRLALSEGLCSRDAVLQHPLTGRRQRAAGALGLAVPPAVAPRPNGRLRP